MFGHWEADSVIGTGANLHTEVERKTRFLMARIIPDKSAAASVGAQLAMFRALPEGARISVTHDNGTEFARHTRLRDELGMATTFADPYVSWQRASCENRNGMIRRYLPKRCTITMDMAREVQEIVDETDNRPMRSDTAHRPKPSLTNCYTYKPDNSVALSFRQRRLAKEGLEDLSL